MNYYLWPYTNRWWFDPKAGRHRQEIAAVRPVDSDENEKAFWPGFVRVEVLGEDLSPTGVYNYLPPEQLYADIGDRIAPKEAQQLLKEAETARSRRISRQLSARTTKLKRVRKAPAPTC